MPEPKVGQNRKDYMENCVPKLIKEGKNPDQAVAVCSSMWEAKAEEDMEICKENSIEFSASVTDMGFEGITHEESLFGDKSFSEILAMLGTEPGKRYEIEICIEEV